MSRPSSIQNIAKDIHASTAVISNAEFSLLAVFIGTSNWCQVLHYNHVSIMSFQLERRSEPPEIIEARCEGLHIRTGKGFLFPNKRGLADDHEIAAPGMRASAILTYRAGSGEPQRTRISDRHVSVIPAGHLVGVEWSSDAPITTFTVKPSFLKQMGQASGYKDYEITAQYASVDPFMWHLARMIEQQMQIRRELETSYVESIAVVLGQHLLCTYADSPAPIAMPGGLPRYKIRRAVDYIRANFRDDISFKDIADQLDMSPYHFARMFKHSMHESPHQFIMRCRIEAAKKLLIESDMSISNITIEVGYKSQSYFTTRFALLIGMTPAAFRGTRQGLPSFR